MRHHPQKCIDAEMKQRVRDYRYYYRQEQCMAAIRARAGDNPAKRRVKRVADRNDKLNESGGASCCHQRQQKTHPEQRVDYPEDVIDDLRDSRESSRSFDFALSVNDLVNSFRTKLTGNMIYSLCLAGRCFRGGACTDISLYFAFNLTLY
jgi:hypothetical protein